MKTLHQAQHLEPQHLAPTPRRSLWRVGMGLVGAALLGASAWWILAEPARPQPRLPELAPRSAWTSQAFTVTVLDRTYTPQKADLERWYAAGLEASANPQATILGRATAVRDRLCPWVEAIAAKHYIAPQPGKRKVSAQGHLVQLLADPRDGQQVTGVDQACTDLAEAAIAGRSSQQTLPVRHLPASIEDTPADLPPLPYTPQGGEKWIDINLSTNTVSGYQGHEIVFGPVAAVPGHRLAPTKQGQYAIYTKYEQQTMRGVGFDGPYAETAPWIMYFTGDFALHAAPWRNSFVYHPERGSHGCVNISTPDAKWFYDWAPIGTPVIVHP